MRIIDYFKNSISVDLLSTKSLKYNGVEIWMQKSEAHSKVSQTSKVELLVIIANY